MKHKAPKGDLKVTLPVNSECSEAMGLDLPCVTVWCMTGHFDFAHSACANQ